MKPFLQGKKSSAIEPLRLPPGFASMHPHAKSGVAAASTGGSASDGANTPTVEVIKEGDKVVRLVIVCTCGQRVEVDCLYPAGH